MLRTHPDLFHAILLSGALTRNVPALRLYGQRVAIGRSGECAMSNEKLGSRECYICKSYIPPLVSICWKCGYSQLPNPHGDGTGKGGKDAAPPKREPDLKKGLDLGKADFKAGIKKK